MSALIKCLALTKSFGGQKALDNLNLTVSSGSATGLVGPNGAGKTTLFSILSGFLNPTSGIVQLWDQHPNKSSLKGRIGILPQDTTFMKGISVQSQLTLFARLQGFKKRGAKNETLRVLELLDIVNLANQYPETLSYGQRKRVTIAQALIGQPDLILLDEPTSGLDPVAANEVRRLIQKLSGESTFVVSSHNLDEIEDVCDQIILIDKGKVIKHCAISELIEQDTCLTFLLGQALAEEVKKELTSHSDINRIESDPGNPQRIFIYFRSDNPDSLQIKILEILQKNGSKVLEFSRGAALTDKVVNLVKKG